MIFETTVTYNSCAYTVCVPPFRNHSCAMKNLGGRTRSGHQDRDPSLLERKDFFRSNFSYRVFSSGRHRSFFLTLPLCVKSRELNDQDGVKCLHKAIAFSPLAVYGFNTISLPRRVQSGEYRAKFVSCTHA